MVTVGETRADMRKSFPASLSAKRSEGFSKVWRQEDGQNDPFLGVLSPSNSLLAFIQQPPEPQAVRGPLWGVKMNTLWDLYRQIPSGAVQGGPVVGAFITRRQWGCPGSFLWLYRRPFRADFSSDLPPLPPPGKVCGGYDCAWTWRREMKFLSQAEVLALRGCSRGAGSMGDCQDPERGSGMFWAGRPRAGSQNTQILN